MCVCVGGGGEEVTVKRWKGLAGYWLLAVAVAVAVVGMTTMTDDEKGASYQILVITVELQFAVTIWLLSLLPFHPS